MGKGKKSWMAGVIRNTARYFLLIISIIVFLFSLVAGSEAYGGGLTGIIKNSPNALPWLILLGFTLLAWKRELAGGILVTVFGIASLYYFNTGANFFLSTFILTLLITLMGVLLLLGRYLNKRTSTHH